MLEIDLIVSSRPQKTRGVTGSDLFTRVAEILLAALAARFIIDGIKGSGVVG